MPYQCCMASAKSEEIMVRVTAADKAMLEKVKKTLDQEQTLSAWIRETLRQAAEKRLRAA